MAWKNPFYNPEYPHHRPQGFCNPGGNKNHHSYAQTRRWRSTRRAAHLPKPPQGGYAAFQQRWWQQADFNQRQGDAVWWLGHAMLLLHLDGQWLLTDPVFSLRASPLPFIGPARKTPLPFQPKALPAPNVVLISHNHYDHLDRPTIRYLARHYPDVPFFVPLGLKSWFNRLGIQRVCELDWWQHAQWCGLTLHCVPAQHWSMRSLWDRNRSLWCGWLVQSTRQRFWFSGDSGYSDLLQQIPQRLGNISAAALPIGAYQPRWFMAHAHMDPQSAVRLWHYLGCPPTVPIHWGVFELADEALDRPVIELTDALSGQPRAENFAPLPIGGYLSLSY